MSRSSCKELIQETTMRLNVYANIKTMRNHYHRINMYVGKHAYEEKNWDPCTVWYQQGVFKK